MKCFVASGRARFYRPGSVCTRRSLALNQANAALLHRGGRRIIPQSVCTRCSAPLASSCSARAELDTSTHSLQICLQGGYSRASWPRHAAVPWKPRLLLDFHFCPQLRLQSPKRLTARGQSHAISAQIDVERLRLFLHASPRSGSSSGRVATQP